MFDGRYTMWGSEHSLFTRKSLDGTPGCKVHQLVIFVSSPPHHAHKLVKGTGIRKPVNPSPDG